MATKPLPCPTLVRLFLRCDAETGKLFWKPRARVWFASNRSWLTWNKRYAGREAMTALDSKAYRQGSILGANHLAHRIVWVLVRGVWPSPLDHINGDQSDNRIENLREATHAQNCLNRGSRKGASSAYLGVDRHKPTGKWRAQIKPQGAKAIYLGLHKDERDAAMAYDKAAREYHGEFARLNFPAGTQ